jgi:hypothetical protein
MAAIVILWINDGETQTLHQHSPCLLSRNWYIKISNKEDELWQDLN